MEEELNQILTNEELDATARAEAIKNLVGKNYVPVKKHTDAINKLKTDYDTMKTEYTQFKETKMTDEEKQAELIKQEREKAEKQSRMLSKLFAENTFSKAGFDEEDYKEIIPTIIRDDPEETKSIAEQICNAMVSQRKSIEDRIKQDLIKGQKKPEGGNADGDEGLTEIEKYKKAYNEAVKNNDRVAMATYTRLIAEAQNK